jgi:hypothetical protein
MGNLRCCPRCIAVIVIVAVVVKGHDQARLVQSVVTSTDRDIIHASEGPGDQILDAIQQDRFLVSIHAEERCDERGVAAWQLVAEIDEAEIMRERPASKPNPSVVLKQFLADGTQVEVIWSWLEDSRRAQLVTVYFED